MTSTAPSSNAISALGAGSGIDVKALATNLVEAERAPRKDLIDKKIAKAEGGISGYSAIKFVLQGLNTALMDIKDQSDFESLTTRNSQASAVNVTASATASAGSHTVKVESLATAQRNLSTTGYATSGTVITENAVTLSLNINSTSHSIDVDAGKATPGGVVAAINAANLGVKAQLINTGDTNAPIKIMVTGPTGAANEFT